MGSDREIRVADRPPIPLVVFDGDCAFCRQWIDRWRGMTGEAVEYRPSREVAGRFPEIGEGGFQARVWLIEPGGRASGGSGAVLRLYARAGEKKPVLWIYEHLPGFARAAEAAYDLVAAHRDAAMVAVRWLSGTIDQRPRYRRTRSILLRGLGAVYVVAFWSLAVQVDGLIGSRGIEPASRFLDGERAILGDRCYGQVPSLLWVDSSDHALHALCWGGVAGGLMLAAGILPGASLVFLWAAYLSLTVVGHPFMGYQWDALLLEAGLLAILLTPWGLRLGRARDEPSGLAIWLIRWLLFRLMFLSGLVKLAGGDPTWAAWSAMKYHYETQPLPAWTSWYIHQMPPWFQALSVGFTFWAELIVPFFVFGPRRVRMAGFWSLLAFQALIAATGNFGFFNLLTAVLCLILVEDRDWGRDAGDPTGPGPRPWRRAFLAAAGSFIVLVTTMEAVDRPGRALVTFPEPLEACRRWVAPFRSFNAYGLFAMMTTDRPEIVIEGSEDGKVWKPYTFRWKPGDPGRHPRFATPHLPRLDWQMWFAALGDDCTTQPWFLDFEARLLEGSPPVLALLANNPFPGRPPRYLRARRELYRFTAWGDRDWWRKEDAGMFCPPVGLPGPITAAPASGTPSP